MVAMVTPTTGTTNMVVKEKSSSSKKSGKGGANADDRSSPSGTVPLRRSTRRRSTIKRLLVNDDNDDDGKRINSNNDGSDKEEKNYKVKHEHEETVSVPVLPVTSSPSTKTTEVVAPEAPLSSSNFEFRGQSYNTYEAMVKAKRQFNQRKMLDMGLMDAVENVHEAAMQEKKKKAAASASQRGLTKRKETRKNEEMEPVRQSKRLRGVKADNRYIEEERGRTFTFGQDGTTGNDNGGEEEDAASPPQIRYMKDRVCDAGESLSIKQAIDQAQDSSNGKFAKWVGSSVEEATTFLSSIGSKDVKVKQQDEPSPKSVAIVAVNEKVKNEEEASAGKNGTSALKDDDEEDDKVEGEEQHERELPSAFSEDCVAKVTPDRIYGICCHPSKDKIIVAAGDKQGYLGLWNATADEEVKSNAASTSNRNNDVHLFQPHSRPINHLEWNTDGTALYSISYDSSIRKLDLATQTFEEIFATYDDSSSKYKTYPGYMMDQGYKFWIQNGTLLPTGSKDNGMWFCTSVGTVVELDLRLSSKCRIVNHVQVSDKKVNTISVCDNMIATGGLDTSVKLWDVRNFSSNTKHIVDAWTPTTKSKSLLTKLQYPKSINSAYFSPSNGSKLLVTTMSNVIDVHDTNTLLSSNASKGKPTPLQRIPHDNHTGRWLSTFMAQWNPSSDGNEFVAGSMTHPRRMDLFTLNSNNTKDTTKYERHSIVGEYMTSVSSRCCFHPNSPNKLILCGGNSSGRVTVAR